MASIGRAAAKHRSPIICDSPQCREPVCAICLPPPCHCKHKVGFTFTFTLTQRRHRPATSPQPGTRDLTHSETTGRLHREQTLAALQVQRRRRGVTLAPKAGTECAVAAAGYYCSILVPGQVDECPSTEWSARPEQS